MIEEWSGDGYGVLQGNSDGTFAPDHDLILGVSAATGEPEVRPEAAVVLLIDNNTLQISSTRWIMVKEAAVDMVNSFTSAVDVTFGVVTYSDVATPIHFSSDRDEVISEIEKLEQVGDTRDLYSGVVESKKY